MDTVSNRQELVSRQDHWSPRTPASPRDIPSQTGLPALSLEKSVESVHPTSRLPAWTREPVTVPVSSRAQSTRRLNQQQRVLRYRTSPIVAPFEEEDDRIPQSGKSLTGHLGLVSDDSYSLSWGCFQPPVGPESNLLPDEPRIRHEFKRVNLCV